MPTKRQHRPSISVDTQAAIYFRDGWLCSLCRRPTIFGLALKRAARQVDTAIPGLRPAYFDPQWRRDLSPLLDELGACIDHVEAFSKGGAHDHSNFATACARCNARKGARKKEEYLALAAPWKVSSRHGEPTRWDGLTGLFVALARDASDLTRTERAWLAALERYVAL